MITKNTATTMSVALFLFANSVHAGSSLASNNDDYLSSMLAGNDSTMMTEHEMEKTSGDWGPVGALVGAATGTALYVVEKRVSGEKVTWKGAAKAGAVGAALGAVSGPVGIVAKGAKVARTAKRAGTAAKSLTYRAAMAYQSPKGEVAQKIGTLARDAGRAYFYKYR